jgi:octanoyl-[GcvH]:protein N-octanoyltransferase
MVDLKRRVVAALVAEAPDATVEPPSSCPQSNVDRDLVLLDAVLADPDPSRRVRIWTNPRCVVISKRLAAQGAAASLAACLRTSGVALAGRASGGTAVVHRPGVLNISLTQVDRPGASMVDAYGELTGLLGRALRHLGLATEVGPAQGAYCDGAHNLLWQGRKLAGTAAVVRRRNGRTGRLVHASLVVWGDVGEDIRLIRLAERTLPRPAAYAPAAHATVLEALCASHLEP